MSGDLLQTLHPGRHRAMLASYGFGLFPVPTYRDAAFGEWRVFHHGPGPVEGYVSGLVMEPCRHVLHQGRTAWMSTSLMEQESHAFHVHQARGVVVVAGGGVGGYGSDGWLKPPWGRGAGGGRATASSGATWINSCAIFSPAVRYSAFDKLTSPPID